MSYRPMVLVGNEWAGNALRFASYEEARDNAIDLACRWMLVMDYRAEESADPVNYRWVDGKLEEVA
jgi:hypothetical protein